MNRKRFVGLFSAIGGALATASVPGINGFHFTPERNERQKELSASVIICGGGLGGCAAAFAALRNNLNVILTEETDWIGGQLTQQGVPPDEHEWIETTGCTKLYRDFRNSVRQYYKRNYTLTKSAQADKYFNPGNGAVSKLCHEPRVALAVLTEMLAPYVNTGKLILLKDSKITAADYSRDTIRSVTATNQITGDSTILSAPYFIDATELGDLLPLTGTEFITGSESQKATRELHAPENADPENNQSFNYCFAIDHLPGENYTIEKPRDYEFWHDFKPKLKPSWPGKLLDFHYSNPSTLSPKELGFNPAGADTSPLFNLWTYRRILNKTNFKPGYFKSDITVVNWPQNDFMKGNLVGASADEQKKLLDSSKQLSLSLLYWLQTEAPHGDKGNGWSGLRLRKDIMGTTDGLAKHPYIRESRRIRALFTVLEEHVGKENRKLLAGKENANSAAVFNDSVGIGYYHIDLHPTCGGNNYIDFDSLPFQVPLGSLLPERMQNLIPANKNIGTTHITNGCYRLHPVEWSIGEAAGSLIAFSLKKNIIPKAVREKESLLKEFQNMIRAQGIETNWPNT
jgi:hypothetical protein